jgi:hypothetical protein
MRFLQRKMIGKRTEAMLRYACMIGSTLAGVLFAFLIIVVCIASLHEHVPAGMWFVLPLFGTFAGFALYISHNLWRESFSSSPQRIITKLQAQKLSSIEFYDIAGGYFRRRFHVIQISGLFFFFMALLCVTLVFVSQVPWWFDILLGVSSLFCAVIGRIPYRLGTYGLRMIEAARKLDAPHRIDALHFMAAKKLFRADPVGIFILRLLNDDEPPSNTALEPTPTAP